MSLRVSDLQDWATAITSALNSSNTIVSSSTLTNADGWPYVALHLEVSGTATSLASGDEIEIGMNIVDKDGGYDSYSGYYEHFPDIKVVEFHPYTISSTHESDAQAFRDINGRRIIAPPGSFRFIMKNSMNGSANITEVKLHYRFYSLADVTA